MTDNTLFAQLLLQHYDNTKRDLPWRKTRDPYKIWLSEIMLQQTQVKQALPYYEKFTDHFPDVEALAKAEEQAILLLWQGLGYYSRARNLHAAARYVTDELGGKFPDNFKDLKKLKGVGEYTAAAIASIAYDQPVAAVDGNVLRIIARVFNIQKPVNSPEGKKIISEKAHKLLDQNRPGDFNQALMDLGASLCGKANPKCEECPVNSLCEAFSRGTQTELPVKRQIRKQEKRYLNYFCILSENESEKHILLKKRIGKGIWQNLYDFPLSEYHSKTGNRTIQKDFNKRFGLQLPAKAFIPFDKEYKHILSHRILFTRFFLLQLSGSETENILKKNPNIITCRKNQLNDFPKPQLMNNFFRDYEKTLF